MKEKMSKNEKNERRKTDQNSNVSRKTRKKYKKWIILGIGVAVFVIAGAGISFLSNTGSEKGEVVYKETTVQRGNLTYGITESGSVTIGTLVQEFELEESSSSSQSYSAMGGGMAGGTSGSSSGAGLEVEEVYAASGQNVKTGDALLKISQESIDDYRDSLKDAVSDASASLSEAKLAAEKKKLTADYGYSTSVAKGNIAAADYNATLAQLEAEVNSAQENVDYYAAAADYYWNLVMNGDKSYEDKLHDAQDKYDEATAKLTTAQNNYTVKSIEAKKQYEETMMNYNNASSQYSIDVNGIDSDVESATDTLAEAKEALEEFEAFIGDGMVYAEYEGKLMSVGYAAGDVLSVDTAIAEYADAVTMTVAVSQEDVSVITVGDTVLIELTAYGEEEFSGFVSGIDISTSSGSSTVSYNVTVTFTGDISKVYMDMTGNVTFIQKQVPDVIYVSNKAIINEGTVSYVKIKKENGSFEKVEVETGFSDGVNVEIISGLNEGDIAIIESRVVSES